MRGRLMERSRSQAPAGKPLVKLGHPEGHRPVLGDGCRDGAKLGYVRKAGIDGRHKNNVWPTPSARVNLDNVQVCINVSGLRVSALAKMDLARRGPHKDGGVEHHIFAQAVTTRGQPLRHLSFTSTDIVSGVGP